jgi:hypothetical protein
MTIVAAWASTALNHRSELREAATNPHTAPDDLEKLAESTNEYVLGDVAGNPKLSLAALRKLADRRGYQVEWGRAHNRSTPDDILFRLADSPNEYTRGYVAANPNAPADVLAVLSKDRIDQSLERCTKSFNAAQHHRSFNRRCKCDRQKDSGWRRAAPRTTASNRSGKSIYAQSTPKHQPLIFSSSHARE